ncbi:MAG: DNA (cytosine-5-)-methyltransferase, partial [Gottschalkiaceae bacterium]
MDYVIDKAKVHEIMKSNGISTQQELANMIGITKNQLSVILSSKTVPFKSTYINLCSALNVSPFEIITLNNDKEKIIKDNPEVENEIEEEKYIDVTTVIPKRVYKSVELFAGAGGLALGLEQAGFEEIGLVEIDKYAAETLRINRPEWNVIENDIIKVADDGISKYIVDGADIDLVSGGYPCQAFSYAGYKLGLEDVRGTMFYYFAQIVEELKPKLFLAENVRGLISHDGGKTLQSMVNIYESLGYNVTWHLIKANDYNVAQKRERIIIVGIRKDFDFKYILPKPYDYKPVLRDVLN